VFQSKFGEALVASNPMVLIGWLTSKTQKSCFKQCTNFLFQSFLYAALKHTQKRKKTSKKSKGEMKSKPIENLT